MKGLLAKFGNVGEEFKKLAAARANKDILEAAVAGCIIVGASDGNFSNQEEDELIDGIMTSTFVQTAGYTAADVSAVAAKFSGYRPTSRAGKQRLMEEIQQAGARPQTAEFAKAIAMVWIDVAEKEDGIDEKEKAALLECATAIGFRDMAAVVG